MQKPPSAADYDAMTDGIELPGDPKPMGSHALQARRRAINTDRLRAISSTELEAQKRKNARKPEVEAPPLEHWPRDEGIPGTEPDPSEVELPEDDAPPIVPGSVAELCEAFPDGSALVKIGTNAKGASQVVKVRYVAQQALKRSKLTVNDWNAVGDNWREAHMRDAIEGLKAELDV